MKSKKMIPNNTSNQRGVFGIQCKTPKSLVIVQSEVSSNIKAKKKFIKTVVKVKKILGIA